MPKRTPTTANRTMQLDPEYVAGLLSKLHSGAGLRDTADTAVVAGIVETWAHLVERARRHDLSLAEIRRILGVLGRPRVRKATDDTGNEAPRCNDASTGGEAGAMRQGDGASPMCGEAGDTPYAPLGDTGEAPAPAGHGRRGETNFAALPLVRHAHSEMYSGCPCPACERGRVYRFFARTFYSISGQPAFAGHRHEVERLQCNVCAEIFEAPLPAAMQADGVGNGRLYTYSAHSAVVLLKYLGVMPWHRQQTVQAAMGVDVPDACMWDMCRLVGELVAPVGAALQEAAAAAPLLYGDDTTARIFGLNSEAKVVRGTGKQASRTGCHTTAVFAQLDDGAHVAIFRIGIQHTGELLDEILCARPPQLPAPMVMTDAASCNEVTACLVLMCACNAHALRRFKELETDYPSELSPILSAYRAIYKHDAATKSMSTQERLAYHREHSRPLFKQMCRHGHTLLEEHVVEPNSKLGTALDYLLNHERRLSAFYRLPGAPVDNNLSERQLRLAVRLRDAAPLYRSQRGARVAAGLWTVLVTAVMHGENAFDYLNAVQRFATDVRANPAAWLPYNYRERLEALQNAPPTIIRPDYTAARRRAAEAAENDC